MGQTAEPTPVQPAVALIPVRPEPERIASMCMRHDHGYGIRSMWETEEAFRDRREDVRLRMVRVYGAILGASRGCCGPDAVVEVPLAPDGGRIAAMCQAYGYDDGALRPNEPQGLFDLRVASYRMSMRQLYEEATGQGFFRPDARG